jgi:hypothetical protein
MRTTLTLDPDVAVLLQREVEESGLSFKAVVNEKIRQGFCFSSSSADSSSARRAVDLPAPLRLGSPKVPNFDNVAEILELIDGDGNRK